MRRWMRSIPVVLALASGPGVTSAPAQDDAAASQGATSEEEALLALLAEETDIATKTRMNSDWVPGIVTVLHGDELEALGVLTAWEALALVPGIQIVRDQRGSPSLTIRGIDFIFNTGNTKVLVNGVSMSRESAGANNSILLMPVEQIERIEVIRGPGSAIHGDFAFQGLINVVTRQEEGRVLVRGEDPDAWTALVHDGWSTQDGRVRGSVSASGLESDDADAPVPTVSEEERRTLLGGIEGPFGAFRAQAVTRTYEPEPGPGVPTALDEENWALAWTGRFPIAKGWSVDARAAHSGTDHDLGAGGLTAGDVSEIGLHFVHEAPRHETIVGVEWWTGDVERGFVRAPPPTPNIDLVGAERTIRSATFQEQIRATDALTITVGARWDDFTDIDSELSPRIAMVWKATARDVIKAQHAKAFRAPTHFELRAPGPDPDSERMSTSELGWIHRRPSTVVRLTAFHSELEEGLGPGPMGPANIRSAEVKGLEAEWTASLHERLKLVTNVSWVDPTEDSFVFGWSEWLGNVALVARLSEHVGLGTHWYHVGTRRTPAGARYEGTDWVDLTLSFRDVGAPGMDFRVGGKNVLDDDYLHPIPTPFGDVTPTFAGVTAWASLAYRW